MLTTKEYIEEVKATNKLLAENALLKYGETREEALNNVKQLYSKRPSEGSYVDLKAILEVLGVMV